MDDQTRPDQDGRPVDASVQRVVDALTAPATPDELAREQAYVSAFLAARRGEVVVPVVPLQRPRTPHRHRAGHRRSRLVVAGAAAALAVTGTAAALTGTVPGSRSAAPSSSAPGARTTTATSQDTGAEVTMGTTVPPAAS